MNAPPNSTSITRDGIEVRVGQVWRDLDRRANGRTITVVRVDARGGFAWYSEPRRGRISISRMHRHHNGWTLVGAKESAK